MSDWSAPDSGVDAAKLSEALAKIHGHGEVLIIAEQIDGKIQPVVYELLGAGRDLVTKLHAMKPDANPQSLLSVALLGHNIREQANSLIAHGADKVYVADDAELANYRTLPYRRVLIDLMEQLPQPPHIVLLGSTTTGRDLAPRIAAHFNTGLTADTTELDIGPYEHTSGADAEKLGLYPDCLYAVRPSFGESLKARILGPWKNPQMATTRPGVMAPLPADPTREGKIVDILVNLKPEDTRVQVIELVREMQKGVNLADADVIVAGGFGLGSADGFDVLRELAACFPNSAIGASRKVVDLGWIPYQHQIGQTGKSVRPKLYIAVGISGAIQHRVGMSKADCIIAIDKDPDAPIFKFAHHGIVGDWAQIVPEMIRQLKNEPAALNGKVQKAQLAQKELAMV
ncbi:MAG: electron transfer flavoprotein subunit alpha/FixB family protein [Vampirovibrionales bacterium]|nr:electron transfer flavoprotein subunit alpha/FixB family protein [Vampirovibrionales bacterium]